MKKLKAIVLLASLLASMTLSTLSCGQEAKKADENETTTAGGDTVETVATEETKLLPNLEEADFGGHEFRMLTRDSTSADWQEWIPRDVYAEEETGEPINDAVYQRNVYLEEKYNFKIVQVPSTDFAGNIKKAVTTGEDLYDVVFPGLRDTPPMAQAGYFLDLKTVPNIDLSKPWWDQNANNSLSFLNKLYFTSGDIMIINKDALAGIVFNKQLLKDNSLDDPYELVNNNEWTISKLVEMCKDVSKDLNGDGEITYQYDRYGFIGQRDATTAIYIGTGEVICEKDADDIPVVTFGSERSFRALEEYFTIMYDQKIAHNAHHLEGKVPSIYRVSEEMFMGDRALFMWVRLRIVEMLRGMDTDFGILPMPKLDSAQTEWGHMVNSYTGCSFAIPVTADPERTGFIAEAIAAESTYTTVPAYYELSLKTKLSRDEESSKMLDIIFSSTVFDIGEIYNFGSLGSDLIYASMTSNRNIASMFEKALTKMEKDIQKAVKNYEKLED